MTLTTTVPIVRVHQEFLRIPTPLTENLLTAVIAPHYLLVRHDQSDEKSLGSLGEYDGTSSLSEAWPNRPTGAKVDTDWTRLFLDNALLEYHHHSLGAGHDIKVKNRTTLEADDLIFRTANGFDRSGEFNNRDVQIGDVLRIVDVDGVEAQRRVVGFGFEPVEASVDDPRADDNNQDAVTEDATVETTEGFSGVTVTADASDYDGLSSGHVTETYTITCTRAMEGTDLSTAEFTIESASGDDDVASFTFSDGFGEAHEIGTRGAKLTLTDDTGAEIAEGDKLVIEYKQDYTPPSFERDENATYTGDIDRTYIVRVLSVNEAGNPVVRVTTTTGDDTSGPKAMEMGEFTTIGNFGVRVKFDAESPAETAPNPGDRYYVDATAASDGKTNRINLNRSLPSDIDTNAEVAVTFHLKDDVEIPPYSPFPVKNWEAKELTLDVESGISITHGAVEENDEPKDLPVRGGDLYVQYRALLPDFTDARSTLDDVEDVVDTLGPAVPANPLALAVRMALLNSGGQPVGFIAVPSDDQDGYQNALAKIRDRQRAYSIVPATQDPAIHADVQAHVLAQSSPDRNLFRIAWLNSESDTGRKITDTDSEGNTLKAKFEEHTELGGNIVVQSDEAQFQEDGVEPGDTVRAFFDTDDFGEETWESFTVDAVESEDQLRLTEGPEDPVSEPIRIEIWRGQSAMQQAEHYSGLSSGFGERRVRHVWPPKAVLAGGTEAPGWTVCAALAGLKSGSAPHQPLSGVRINGFDSVPLSTDRMGRAELDEMAHGGTWIVTQEEDGGAVYTRLAVTTDTRDANVWQDARTTNADSLSFAFHSSLQSMVGGRNINDQLLREIEGVLDAVASEFETDAITPMLGPQILEHEIVDGPRQHETLRDVVVITMNLGLPYGMDRLDLFLPID